MRAELVRARESLHEAHRELAAKAEKIRKVEAELKRKPGGKRNLAMKEAISKLEKQLNAMKVENGKLSKELEARDKAIAAANAAEKKRAKSPVDKAAVSKGAAQPEGETSPESSFRLGYAQNSAANLEERQGALDWAKKQLEKGNARKLSLRGYANDRPYETPNLDIANNRVRFLAAYFRTNGVSADAIISEPGVVSEKGGAKGRYVEISVITE